MASILLHNGSFYYLLPPVIFSELNSSTQTMNNWQNKVRSFLKQKSITQEELAEKIGKSQAWLNHKLSGRRRADINEIQLIAKGIGCKLAELLDEKSQIEEQKGIYTTNEIPLIEQEQLIILDETHRAYNLNYATGTGKTYTLIDALIDAIEKQKIERKTIATNYNNHFESLFATFMKGDSMTSSSGLSIPHGTQLTVDTAADIDQEYNEAEKQNKPLLVLASSNNNPQPNCRRLIRSGSTNTLITLNPQYPSEVTSPENIIGSIKEAIYSVTL